MNVDDANRVGDNVIIDADEDKWRVDIGFTLLGDALPRGGHTLRHDFTFIMAPLNEEMACGAGREEMAPGRLPSGWDEVPDRYEHDHAVLETI